MLADVVGWLRIAVGVLVMALGVAVWVLITVPLLPWRILRIKACNWFGKTVCRAMVMLSGSPVTVEGEEHLNGDRPAIYVSNHTSILDLFLCAWLSPVGTVGIAKKEVVWYPFFGWLYLLSGHLRIDRSNSERAIASMKSLGGLVRKHGLSVFIWPEGTRSRDGHLKPFKKGVAHLAMQTGLPVVPLVVSGIQNVWPARSFRVRVHPIHVRVLPAIDTSGWTEDTLDEVVQSLHDTFDAALPADQRAIPAEPPVAHAAP